MTVMDRAMVEQIEKKLKAPFASLNLRADGHALLARVEPLSKTGMKWGCVLYVDGCWTGTYLKKDSEIGVEFYPLRKRQMMSQRDYADYVKLFGKRAANARRRNSVYEYRVPWFASGRALALHLKKHCTSVEIVDTTASGVEAEGGEA